MNALFFYSVLILCVSFINQSELLLDEILNQSRALNCACINLSLAGDKRKCQ